MRAALDLFFPSSDDGMGESIWSTTHELKGGSKNIFLYPKPNQTKSQITEFVL